MYLRLCLFYMLRNQNAFLFALLYDKMKPVDMERCDEMGMWIFMLVMVLLLPVTMTCIGNLFMHKPPRTINGIYGYRTARSMASQDAWDFAHRFFGTRCRKLGWWLILPSAAAMLPVLGKGEDNIGTAGIVLTLVQLVFFIAPIVSTERALAQYFDKRGVRKP